MQAIGIQTLTVSPVSHKRVPLKHFSAVTVDTGDKRGKVTVNAPVQAFIRADGTLTVQAARSNTRHPNGTVVCEQGKGDLVAFYGSNGEQVAVYDVMSSDAWLAGFLHDLINGWS